ncbi:MAG: chemotaxis protein [Synechococcus sp.]
MSSSVSFRITRTAEDLAQTITALTQRLVKLEQRQEALELQVRQQLQSVHDVPDEELATLNGIEQLLQETRQLLQATDAQETSDLRDHEHQHVHDHQDQEIAA